MRPAVLAVMFVLIAVSSACQLQDLPPPLPTSPLPDLEPLQTAALPVASATQAPAPTRGPDAQNGPTCDPSVAFCIDPGHFVLSRPVLPPADDRVDPSYRYGSTQSGQRQPHHGVEFYNPSGTPVYAAGDGQVVVAGDDHEVQYSPWKDFYGRLVVIEHDLPGLDEPVFTLYAHLSEVDVRVGQRVRSGEKIAAVGASGAAIGSHLHFEVRLGANSYENTRNPELWLAPRVSLDGMSTGALAGRVVDGRGSPVTVAITLQHFTDRDAAPLKSYHPELYAHETLNPDILWGESFAISELQPGLYRISLIYEGSLFERWVEVQSGMLTIVMLCACGG